MHNFLIHVQVNTSRCITEFFFHPKFNELNSVLGNCKGAVKDNDTLIINLN